MKNYSSLANEKLLNTFIIFTSVKYLYFYKKKKKKCKALLKFYMEHQKYNL